MLIASLLKIIYLIKDAIIKIMRIATYSLTRFPHCFVCGRHVLYCPICKDCNKKYYTIKTLLPIKRDSFKALDELYSPYLYYGFNKVVFVAWKLHGLRGMTEFYCQKLNIALKLIFLMYGDITLTVVPPRKGKIKNTGYDQMQDIKQYLQYHYNYKFQNLLRRLSTTEQKSLSGTERLATIGKSYSVNYAIKNGNQKVPPVICIIDDLTTTGATLESCALVLKAYGAQKVIAITIYHVIRQS